ncbi:MAG TPA: glycosyltransferase 87 family protein [Candidatus Limnocylindria bacterium]|nr:glycosyltransferase 87 family protein [Candidatus Limnocylindria bacterium]
MTTSRFVWALGVVALALAVPAALAVAGVLPFAYDFRAYWLAAAHLVTGQPMYPALDAPLGQPDEFHYLPMMAIPFVVLLPLGLPDAARTWLAFELVVAALVGLWLIRPLPRAAQPWAAAAYVFFLPMVLEVTLGNIDLLSLALALVAWGARARANAAIVPYAAAVGMKFLPIVLLPFYVAAGYGKIVWRALVLGSAVVLLTAPLASRQLEQFVALLPRYMDTEWVRLHADREVPAWLATIVWSDLFALALALATVALAIVFGLNARRDRAHETEWHHLALALSPYLAPFGFTWTTFLITSLPLFSMTLQKALRLRPVPRAAAIGGLVACWFAMQIVQVRVLWPLVAHFVGVVGLVCIALALTALESQTLGRSSPVVRATSTASG